ncbi:protein TIC 40 [Populus alba x Populus x berolinensis]|nr:protein TIC 40 [Populus alba x Populus x berolinensis]
MENPRLALLSSSSPKLVMGYPTSLRNPTTPKFSISTSRPSLPFSLRISTTAPHASIFSISALANSHGHRRTSKNGKLGSEYFASISSSSGKQTASVGVNPQPVSPPPSQIGSPLFWVGVGVGLSAIFSWVATRVKNYAMQQAFKSLTEQMNTQNNQFNPAFSARPPFPFSPPPASHPSTSPSPAASQPAITVDIPATKVEAAPTTEVGKEKETDFLEEREIKEETKKYAFVDISPEETSLNTPFSSVEDDNDTSSSKDDQFAKKVFQNGAAFKEGPGAAEGSQSTRPFLSVEALEKMMEDPTMQKMVYPYLPEEMRNPTTFKWMLQNPQYRQQLEDMLNNMGGSGKWDSQMMDSLKDFDLNSAEVKQQFDQIGLTPEEVISKIMANPDVAMAFQNPRVQQAIMECSQNPLNITKYQNDKEVMDVFNKISELFPGMTG